MRVFQDLPVRIQLTTILVIIGIIPMILVGYTANQTAIQSVESLAEESLQSTSRQLAVNLDQIFNQGNSFGYNIAENAILQNYLEEYYKDNLSGAGEDYIRSFLNRVVQTQSNFTFAAFWRAPGEYLSIGNTSYILPRFNDPNYFRLPAFAKLQENLDSPQPVLGAWHHGHQNNYDLITFTYPVEDGFFVLGIQESILSSYYSTSVPSSHNVFLFDQEGIVFSSNKSSQKGDPFPTYERWKTTEIKDIPQGNLGGKFFAWEEVSTGWLIGIQVEESNWLQSIANQGRGIFYFILFAVLITLVLAFFFSYQFTKPLLQLQQKMFYASFGTYDLRVPVSNSSELGLLAENFNRLMEYLEKEKTLRLEAEGSLSRLNQRLDHRVKERTKDLERSMEDLTMAQERLVQTEKMAALGGLVAGVAHEINTPLGTSTTAASYIQDIARKIRDKFQSGEMKKSDFERFLEDTVDSLEIILYNLSRSSEIIKDFKNVAVGKTLEDYSDINLYGFFNEIIQSVTPRFGTTRPIFELFVDEDLNLRSDPKQLHQVFTNLFINAWIHGFEQSAGGKITVRAGKKEGKTWIEVQDNGKGMRQNQKQKAFNPFYTTRRGAGGTGLGLHIVYNIVVSSLKGQIELESEEGKGSLFKISLPELE
jgi:signal transduction histidine kinase